MIEPASFEEGLDSLQLVLRKLQEEDTPLLESLKLYATAAELIQYCNKALEEAKLQMEEIDTTLTSGQECIE